MMPNPSASPIVAPGGPAPERSASAGLQRARDELATLEAELANLWPDSRRIQVQLAAGERELAALRAEVQLLEGPRRFLDLTVAGILAALASICAIAVYLLGAP